VFHGEALHEAHLRAIASGRDEPQTIARFLELLEPGDVVYDIGAYLGSFTLRAARAVGPGGRVVAFEPDPTTRAVLMQSVEENGFSGTVEVVAAAVGERAGRAQLRRHPTDPSQHSIAEGRQGSVVDVDVRRLDDERWAPPDVVKIDAEGGDLGVLRSLGERVANVRVAIVEYGMHDPATGDAIVAELAAAGFDAIEVINDRGGDRHPWPLRPEDRTASYVNLCATRT